MEREKVFNPAAVWTAERSRTFASLMSKVYVWMTLALAVTGLTAAYVGTNPGLVSAVFSNSATMWVLVIAELALVWVLSANIHRLSFPVAGLMFIAYSVLNGVTLSLIFVVYTMTSIATTFFVTAGTFAVMSLVGMAVKRDLSPIGRILFMALIGLIIATIVNLFVASSALSWAITYIGVLVFVGLTAYDTQKIKFMMLQYGDGVNDATMKLALMGSLTLYLDFVNLFLYLLRIFGNNKKITIQAINNMNQLSERLNRLSPSATLAMSQKSGELKAQGIDIINLSVGEPDFNTPDHIKEAAKKAIDDNYSRYSPVTGYPALRQAIVDKLKRENGLDYTPAQIVCSNGAKQSVCNTVMALVNAGDEVIIPAPYWVSYPQMVLLAEGTPVIVEAGIEQDFKITPAQLEAAITPRTRLLILCSPSNPTGAVYSAAELEALAEVLRRHERVIVVSDEIYEHINYIGQHASIAACPGMKERTIVVNGVSKAYAMTGWRIGFTASPEWIAKACSKLQGQYTSGPCSVSQMAATAAFAGDQTCVEEMRKAFERRKDLIVRLAKEVPGFEVNEPHGAFYLFPKCSYYFGKADGDRVIKNSTDFAMFLLEVAHVATVGGDAFGSPDCFRMSYATSDENIVEALRRIREAVARLK